MSMSLFHFIGASARDETLPPWGKKKRKSSRAPYCMESVVNSVRGAKFREVKFPWIGGLWVLVFVFLLCKDRKRVEGDDVYGIVASKWRLGVFFVKVATKLFWVSNL